MRAAVSDPVRVSHGPTPSVSGGERVLIHLGLQVGSMPVLVGYHGPRAESDEISATAGSRRNEALSFVGKSRARSASATRDPLGALFELTRWKES
jgi:hypothetical protein